MRALQVGGSGPAGAGHGHRAGPDEVHQAALQVSSRPPAAPGCLVLLVNLLLLLCREVFSLEKFRQEAVSRFGAHRAAMHPVTAALVAKDLKLSTGL